MKIGVIGAGIMGAGIAHVCVKSGRQVLLYDVRLEAAQDAANKIIAEHGTKRLQVCRELKEMEPCDLIIEAVTENLQIKQSIFQSLEEVVPADTILATNTSGLSVTAIASVCRHRGRIIGLHFFNPPEKMPLVELVSGLETAEDVREAAAQFVASLEKRPVHAKDTPGFIVNRILLPCSMRPCTCWRRASPRRKTSMRPSNWASAIPWVRCSWRI